MVRYLMAKITEKQKKEIIRLRKKFLSYGAIAKWVKDKHKVSISPQRIHQITSGYRSPASRKWVKTLWESIKKRDKYRCQWAKLCKGEQKKSKELVVHHLDFDDKNNNPSNLITLCSRCHMSFHCKNHINPNIRKNLCKGSPKGERIKIKCKGCGKIFEVAPSEKRIHCNKDCRKNLRLEKGFQFYMLLKDGIKVVELSKMCCTLSGSISREYRLAQKEYGLADLNLIQRNKKVC